MPMSRSARRLRRRVVLGIAMSAIAESGLAQQVSGTVVAADGRAPASAVLLRAVRVPSREVVAEARTGADGAFRLVIGPDSVEIYALRLGSRPALLLALRSAPEGVSGIRLVFKPEPVVLPSVDTRSTTRCGGLPGDASGRAATLFDQALTMFALIPSADSTLRVRARWRRVVLTGDGAGELSDRSADSSALGLPAPLNRPAEQLFRSGFLATTQDGDDTYFAPSAAFLSSSRFLRDYCLFLRENDPEHAGMIGVGFHPARRFGATVQVSGVIWFRAGDLLPLRLSFGYVGLPPEEASGQPGGWVDFAALRDGRWAMVRWEVRMPQVGEVFEYRRRNPQAQPSRVVIRRLDRIHVHSVHVGGIDFGTETLFSP